MALYANLYGPEGIEYPNGAHAANVPVTVRRVLDGELATLYTGRDKLATVANPIFTDSLGNLKFWADPSTYELEIQPDVLVTITIPLHPNEPVGGGGPGGGSLRHNEPVPKTEWTWEHNSGSPLSGIIARETTGDFIGFAIVENTSVFTTIAFGNPTSGYVDYR